LVILLKLLSFHSLGSPWQSGIPRIEKKFHSLSSKEDNLNNKLNNRQLGRSTGSGVRSTQQHVFKMIGATGRYELGFENPYELLRAYINWFSMSTNTKRGDSN
jgi:hypothetical protein